MVIPLDTKFSRVLIIAPSGTVSLSSREISRNFFPQKFTEFSSTVARLFHFTTKTSKLNEYMNYSSAEKPRSVSSSL